MKVYDDYHGSITSVRELRALIDRAAPRMKMWLAENAADNSITHIAATGTSGVAAAFPLSLALELPVLVVRRKGGEPGAHSGTLISSGDIGDYVLVDDFVSSGSTINHVVSAINGEWERSARNEIVARSSGRPVYNWQIAGPRPICRAAFCYQAYATKTHKPELCRLGEYATTPFDYYKTTAQKKKLEAIFEFEHPEIKCFGMLDG